MDVFIDGYDHDLPGDNFDFIIEATPEFSQTFPLKMANTVVNISQDVTSKVRIMNPFDTELILRQDTVIGEAEKLEREPTPWFEHEDIMEISNQETVRRIQLNSSTQPDVIITNDEPIRSVTKIGTSNNEKVFDVPSHLQDMYNDVAKNHKQEEHAIIADLLNRF